jgi:hypothetical protein
VCPCREAHYPADLLLYAWHNRAKVEAMEAQLTGLLAATSKKRCSMPPMPKQERHYLRLLAEQYGLATQSFGAEPNRHVDLFKVSRREVPLQTWCEQECRPWGASCCAYSCRLLSSSAASPKMDMIGSGRFRSFTSSGGGGSWTHGCGSDLQARGRLPSQVHRESCKMLATSLLLAPHLKDLRTSL